MIRYLLALCFFTLAFNQIAMCAESTPITGAQSFDLTAKQRRELETNAGKGNAEAALKLSKFYSVVQSDVKRQIRWLKRAAELGDAEGQYTLGYVFLNDKDNRNLIEAERWLKEAEITAAKKKDKELLSFVKQTQRDLQDARNRK